MPRMWSHRAAGACGAFVVVGLAAAQWWLVTQRGTGLAAWWLLLLLAPGVTAAHLERLHANAPAWAAGARAGLVTGHLAALLLIVWLVIGVLTTDWTAYGEKVEPETAGAVHAAAIPATTLLGLVTAAVAYAGCVLAGLLGALLYAGLRNMVK